MNTPPRIEVELATNARPTIITVLCVIGFIGGLVALPMIFSQFTHNIGVWYPPFLALSTGFGFVCMFGLWKMRRWAVYAYIGMCAFNQVILLVMGIWSVFALLIPLIVIAIIYSQISKMR
jgi:hypothetical protein